MASVRAFIRVSTKKVISANVRFRLTDGRKIQLWHKSEIEINPALWDTGKQAIKAKVIFDAVERAKFNKAVNERKNLLIEIYNAEHDKSLLTSEWMELEIDKSLNPGKYLPAEIAPQTFFESFDDFLEKHKLSDVRKKNYKVIKRALQRFELYVSKTKKTAYALTFENITSATLREFEMFVVQEHELFIKHPEIYKEIPEVRTPQKRGQNTINDIFTKFRTFYLWSIDAGKTINNPFKGFKVEECVYGTPFYITIEERNTLYNCDLSHLPELAIQRDIFVFQCLIGCRIGDLYKMKANSVMNGAIEYIPRKTKDGRPVTVRVPLNATAKEILNRYPANENEKLLPFIPEQQYNYAIKDAFKAAGITRMVTIINPTTRQEEKRPINEIVSSHTARKSFVGNLYKQVKDPNLVGVLSGHKEGSKAFARYREIDEQMKLDLVNLLN
ncbi:MAG: phage integrase family protein [Bacteroidetes bacterium]|nr:MAG: phage integrase family protein [Bacteroidota bacterium]